MIETIDLQIDTQDLTNEVRAISNTMTDIRQNVVKLVSDIARFSGIADRMASEIRAEVKGLNSVATEIVNSITSVLTTISDTIDKILESGKEPDWLNIANTALQAYATLGSQNKSGIPSTGKGYIGKYESGGMSVFGGAEGSYTANKDSSASGIVGGLGDMSSMLPDDAMLQSLVDMIGKLKESAAAWATQTGAKLADKAVDLQIVALYVVDYVKAFGAAVAQIAASTAAWVTNTAAKVASTAAEWAQIAATTAWNALCAVATTVTTAFGAAMAFLTSPIGIVVVAITALIAIVVLLVKNWDTVSAKVKEVWGAVQAKFAEFDAFLQNVFAHNFTEQFGAFGHILNAFFANVKNIWEAVKTVFSGIINFISGIFSGDWKKAWSGIVDVFSGIWKGIVAVIKVPINGIIGIINALISHVVSGINAVIGVLNNLKFTVPDWIPGLGGKSVNLNLSYVTAPQIPLLAQGAVLPANRPFMAIVGDQKHGTNIEAPLATIQEAVALVMQDQTAALLAGMEALLTENRQLRRTVEGIELGDATIGQASDRYHMKQAIMRGR